MHTTLLDVVAEIQMCVGEVACHIIAVHSKSLSFCPFRLRRPGQGPALPKHFFCERTPLGAALHTSLLGALAEAHMCVGEIAFNKIANLNL